MPEQHALLSASAAHRWLKCPKAPRLEATLPDAGSTYAEEGTLAHAIAELKVSKAIGKTTPRKYTASLKEHRENPLYAPDMEESTDKYLDEVLMLIHSFSAKPYVTTEQQLNLIKWVPEGFGTADCIVVGEDTLHIIDYKHGKGVAVDAENNPQMRLYALGALDAYSLFYDIKRVVTHIIQPRISNFSSEELAAEDLLAWGETVIKPAAALAFAGEGEFHAGNWCRFCRAKGQCKAQAGQMVTHATRHPNPDLLSGSDFQSVLGLLDAVKAWTSQVEEAALARLLSGEEIPGYKLVAGRSVRQFTDIDAAFDALESAGVNRDMLYERKPLTLTATEKVVGQKQFAEICSPFVGKSAGKPTIAPETDKRPAINPNDPAAVFAPAI